MRMRIVVGSTSIRKRIYRKAELVEANLLTVRAACSGVT